MGMFLKIQEICYIIATRILKIHAEMAEIIEAEDGTCKIDIFFCQGVIAK